MFKEIFIRYISKTLFWLTIIGILGFGVYQYTKNRELKRRYTELLGYKEKFKLLEKDIAQLEIKYKREKDLNLLLKKQFKDFEKVIKKKDYKIKLLSDVVYNLKKHIKKQHGPDYIFYTPKKTKNFAVYELKADSKENSPPWGYVLIKSDGTVYKKLYNKKIIVKIVQIKNEKNGKIKVFVKGYLKLIDSKSTLSARCKKKHHQKKCSDEKIKEPIHDKLYALPIESGTVTYDPTEPVFLEKRKRFYFFAPHINVGLHFSILKPGEFYPAIGMSFMGYGKTKNDLNWKFLELGAEFTTSNVSSLYFAPVSYRILGDSTLFSNTYITAGLSIKSFNPTSNSLAFVGVEVGF